MNQNVDGRSDNATHAEALGWLIDYIARLLGIERTKISSKSRFDTLGLDSMMVVVLTEEMGSWLGRDIDPIAVYEFPVIDDFARYVAASSSQPR